MIKFGSTKDIYARQRNRRQVGRQVATTSEPVGLDGPPSICLDDLRALIPSTLPGRSRELEPPKNVSLEKLQELIKPSQELEDPPEIDLDDLRDLLEPAGVVTREVDFTTRDFLSGPSNIQETSKFRAWQNVTVIIPLDPKSMTASETVEGISGENAAKVKNLASTGVETSKNLPEVKVKVVEKKEAADIKLDGPESFLKKLEELADGDNLEKWIASLNLPQEFDLVQIRTQIRNFLKEKCWEKDGKLRFGMMDGSLAKSLWAWFKELSIAKQILVVIGLSICAAVVGFLTLQFVAFIWPGILGVATSGEAALREIGIEGFKIRQEPAFQLLHLHAEQAKPMSYAWANQYVLWKYCRNRH